MTTESTMSPTSAPAGKKSTQAIERDIEQTRERLKESIGALAARTDLRQQSRQTLNQVRAQVLRKRGSIAALTASAVALTVVRRRKRTRL